MTSANNQPAVDIDFSNTLPLAIVNIDSHMWLVCTECTTMGSAKIGRFHRGQLEDNGLVLEKGIRHVFANHD